MRFWITKNSELPVREQLARQVILGILSEDLPAGHKLPSIRAFARRHNVHPNTVSAAYHDLLQRGWLELRRGSGVYVKQLPAPGSETRSELTSLLTRLLQDARTQGYEPEQVLDSLEQMVRPRKFARIIVADTENGLREILVAELTEQGRIPVEAMSPPQLAGLSVTQDCVVAAIASRTNAVRQYLPKGLPFITLRMNSVPRSLEGQPRPPADALIAVVSKSFEVRSWSRTMLVAVGIDPNCVCEIDANLQNWQDRLRAVSLVIADIVAARALPANQPARVFRVLAPESLSAL